MYFTLLTVVLFNNRDSVREANPLESSNVIEVNRLGREVTSSATSNIQLQSPEREVFSIQDAFLIRPATVFKVDDLADGTPVNDGIPGGVFKSPLFEGWDSSNTWQTKSPQDWTQNDVILWLEHNSISQLSIEAFKGKIKSNSTIQF
jgi:hypothetical protein